MCLGVTQKQSKQLACGRWPPIPSFGKVLAIRNLALGSKIKHLLNASSVLASILNYFQFFTDVLSVLHVFENRQHCILGANGLHSAPCSLTGPACAFRNQTTAWNGTQMPPESSRGDLFEHMERASKTKNAENQFFAPGTFWEICCFRVPGPGTTFEKRDSEYAA